MNGLLLDTHVWLWVQLAHAEELSEDFLQVFEQEQRAGRVFVSAASVLEIARLVVFDGYDLGSSIETFLALATLDRALQVLELSPQILIDSVRLPGNMHRDPADQQIVTTARAHNLTLVTRDKKLLTYAKQGHLSARKP